MRISLLTAKELDELMYDIINIDGQRLADTQGRRNDKYRTGISHPIRVQISEEYPTDGECPA